MGFPRKLTWWLVVLGTVAIGACQERAPVPLVAPGSRPVPEPAEEAPYWPRFHGPDGTNVSPDSGLLKQWPQGGPPLAWTAEGIGYGFSSVTAARGLLYTAGNLNDKTVITALDLDGRIVWQVASGDAWTGDHEGTRGTPTIDGQRLYHQSPLGELVCLHGRTGGKIWSLNVLEAFGAEHPKWGLAESVLVDGDRVICCPGGPQASVVALDKHTGRTVWEAPSTGEAAGYATATLAEQDGLRMILAMNAKAFIGVDAETGRLLWHHEHRTSWDVNATQPIYHDGHVFITSGYGSGSELLKITVKGNNASVQTVWTSKDLDNHHGGVVLLDGYLYGSNHHRGGKWVALDWKTGRTMYAERGVGKGSLCAAEGMLYTLSERGKVGLVEATPAGHLLRGQFQLPPGGEGPTWAHPVVCGGRLYIRHADRLYAFDLRAGPSP